MYSAHADKLAHKRNGCSVTMTYKLRSKIFLNIPHTGVEPDVLKAPHGNILSCERVMYMVRLGDGWERQYSITAGKHMQQNMNMVLRCGEHSNGCMYVEHGALLALER